MTPEDIEIVRKACTPEVVEQLVEALMFYADPDTYFAVMVYGDSPCGEFVDDIGEIVYVDENDQEIDREQRPGKLARETLSAIFTPHYSETSSETS